LLAGIGIATGAGLGLIYKLDTGLEAADLVLHPQALPWSHNGALQALDMASVRRGYTVYKNVCSACHSLRLMAYRHFVNAFMTDEEAKKEAAEIMVTDGPDDAGKMFERPGKLFDFLPKPYPNDKAAAAANNGAVPPDLSLITLARHGGEDYIFSILTGYQDQEPPAGMKLGPGQAYNPYFLNGVLGMPQQLFDEGVEFEDGTPATMSQQAKDVTTFLVWSSDIFHDTRKLWVLKLAVMTPVFAFFIVYWKRHLGTFLHSRKNAFLQLKGRRPPKS